RGVPAPPLLRCATAVWRALGRARSLWHAEAGACVVGRLRVGVMDAGSDRVGFKAFEAEGWTRKAATYERLTARVTPRFVEPLPDAAAVRSGTRLLDAACGPGRCAAAAAARGGRPLGFTSAGGMV